MRLPFILLLLCTALNFFTACSDDEDIWMDGPSHTEQPQTSTRAAHYTSSLVQEGKYWKATKRVPLVGEGRIVDDFANALVSALSSDSKLDHLTDEDLTNCASFGGGLADVGAIANQIVSVRDMHRTYAGGQKVGFVFKVDNSSLLTLDVLKSFWIQTFLNGKAVESFGNNKETGVLELDLISIAQNDEIKELSFTATQPFDEVQFNVAGISAELLKSLKIYYAFVGENEIKTGTRGSSWFPNAHLHKEFLWTNILNSDHIVDNDLTNYAYYGTLSGLLGDPRATVDFGKDIPAGSEVGFVISKVDVLNIDVLGEIILATYNENDEEMDRATFTDLLGVSLISVGNHTRVSMKTTKPCRQVYINFAGLEVKLGGTNVYYAYACDEVTVDVTSRFSASDVKITGNSYTLPMGKGGSTTWQIVSAVPGTLPEIKTFQNEQGQTVTKIIGMIENGQYRLRGVYTPTLADGTSGTPQVIEFVITREALTIGKDCNQLLGESAGASIDDISGGGSLISLGSFKNPEHLVDNDPDNYATFTNLLAIGADVGIGAIKLKEPVNTNNDSIRVGFTIQNSIDILGLDLLKFFQIRLFLHGDNEVARGIVDKSDVGDVSLIGSKGNKIRMAIKTNVTFDKIELWTVGVLNLKIEGYRFYNAFWESAAEGACPVGDVSEACMEMLTAAQGAKVNYDASKIVGAVTLGGTMENLGNLLDEDAESFAICSATEVAGSAKIAVKFPPLPQGSTIGFIVEAPTGVADLGLLKTAKLEVWSKGALVTKDITGDLLDVDLIGHTGRAFIETKVTKVTEFDEVRISFPAVADVLDTRKVYGVFTRRDTDMDGIPDCAEDEENPVAPVKPISAEIVKKHICEHEILEVKVTQNGEIGENYTLNYWNTFTDNKKVSIDMTLPEEGIFRLSNLPAGMYFIRIEKEGKEVFSGALQAYVHPLQTTWKKNAQTTDWNTWSNWTEGAPWTCTDVVLPTGCVRYPELKELPATAYPDLYNYCANLHIESHAELVNSCLLDKYDYVWMEMSLISGKNYILSSPLTNTVTGDYFIPAKWQGNHSQEHKFVSLTSTNSPENRFAPRLYQRCWSREVPGKVLTDGVLGTTVITSETDWTAPFNAVAEPIVPGMGWMVRAEDEGLPVSELTFRLPKTHGEYSYFDATGAHTGAHEGVYRNRETMGQFAIQKLPCTVTVNNYRAGTTFVVGNPFAAHLNIAKFLEANKEVISEVKLTNGHGTHTVLYQESEITATSPGFTHIAPMQGFYVTAKTQAQQLQLRFTADMQEQKPGYNIYANGDIQPAQTQKPARTRTANGDDHALRILAVSGGKSTQCVVTLRSDSHLDFHSGEDSRLLYDGENPPTVAVFTVAGGVAADIQQLPVAQAGSIDLGWRMEHPRNLTLHLCHGAGSEWSRWVLENRQTKQRIDLENPETVVKLGQQSTRVGGWHLVRK